MVTIKQRLFKPRSDKEFNDSMTAREKRHIYRKLCMKKILKHIWLFISIQGQNDVLYQYEINAEKLQKPIRY